MVYFKAVSWPLSGDVEENSKNISLYLVRISAGRTAVLTEAFNDFPQYLPENYAMLSAKTALFYITSFHDS